MKFKNHHDRRKGKERSSFDKFAEKSEEIRKRPVSEEAIEEINILSKEVDAIDNNETAKEPFGVESILVPKGAEINTTELPGGLNLIEPKEINNEFDGTIENELKNAYEEITNEEKE